MAAKENGDRPQAFVRQDETLSDSERKELQRLIGDEPIEAVADADLDFAGIYGHNRLVITDRRVLVVEGEQVTREVPLEEIASAHCLDYVGNGVLEVRRRDGGRSELVRYSRTLSNSFQEVADRINRSAQVDEEELEAQQDEIAKVAGPSEVKKVYRCPNCGHPLRNPSDACPKCTSKRQVMWRLLKLMDKHWKLAAAGLVLSAVFTAATLGPAYLVKELIDTTFRPVEVTSQQVLDNMEETGAEQPDPALLGEARQAQGAGRHSLHVLVALFFGLITLRGIISHYRTRVMGTLGERVVVELRNQLYRTLQRLSLSYYDREHTGRIMARVLSDTRIVQRFVVEAVQQTVINILTVIGICAILFARDWQLAAIALVPIPFVMLVAKFFSGKFRAVYRTVRRRFANLSASVSETISGMRVVKSFAQEDREIHGFVEKNADVYNARMAAVEARSRFGPFIGWLMGLGTCAVWFFGGREVLRGLDVQMADGIPLTLGTLVMFITLMNQFYGPVRQLMNLTEIFQESATAAERVFNIMDMPSEVGDHEDAVEAKDVNGRVEIQNVSFAYNEGERVLKNINLSIEPGEMIGLVGQTGSGKSTLVSLVCRFYDPTKGRILLDGKDLQDIKTRSLRNTIGMVLQDPFLFAGTIRENISYGRPEAIQAEIIEAARTANAHEFIMNLPDGYDSDVGERGVMLSGGEKQRISIARAILKDPAILVLDEATSAVDTATEALIQDAMDRLVHGRTTIAIAHRLSTLRNADRLIVLDEGEIIEQGTHDELIAQDGTYARLCRIQAEFANALPDA